MRTYYLLYENYPSPNSDNHAIKWDIHKTDNDLDSEQGLQAELNRLNADHDGQTFLRYWKELRGGPDPKGDLGWDLPRRIAHATASQFPERSDGEAVGDALRVLEALRRSDVGELAARYGDAVVPNKAPEGLVEAVSGALGLGGEAMALADPDTLWSVILEVAGAGPEPGAQS